MEHVPCLKLKHVHVQKKNTLLLHFINTRHLSHVFACKTPTCFCFLNVIFLQYKNVFMFLETHPQNSYSVKANQEKRPDLQSYLICIQYFNYMYLNRRDKIYTWSDTQEIDEQICIIWSEKKQIKLRIIAQAYYFYNGYKQTGRNWLLNDQAINHHTQYIECHTIMYEHRNDGV